MKSEEDVRYSRFETTRLPKFHIHNLGLAASTLSATACPRPCPTPSLVHQGLGLELRSFSFHDRGGL